MPTRQRAIQDNMFFISFIICIILNVAFVQPIVIEQQNINATHTSVPLSEAKNLDKSLKTQNESPIFSDSGVLNPSADKKNDKNVENSSNSSIKVPDSSSNNTTEQKHSRRVTNTSIEIAPIKQAPVQQLNNSNSSNINNSVNNNVVNKTNEAKVETKLNATSKIESNQVAINGTANNTLTNQTNKTISTPTSTTKTPMTKSTSKSTTTTTKQMKPTVTFSVEDVFPHIEQLPKIETPINEPIREPVLMQSSETIAYPDAKSSKLFLVPIIGMIVVIPLMVMLTNCVVRKARDYWSKRKYRRMDYLIEDMYN